MHSTATHTHDADFFLAVLKQVAVVLENALGGTAGGVKTNLTHVLLVAVVLTVLFCTERIRSALKKR
jgi:hypothetical protein